MKCLRIYAVQVIIRAFFLDNLDNSKSEKLRAEASFPAIT